MSSTSEQSIFSLVNYSVSCEMEQKFRDHSLSTRSESRKRDSPVTMRPALVEHADLLAIVLHPTEPVSTFTAPTCKDTDTDRYSISASSGTG